MQADVLEDALFGELDEDGRGDEEVGGWQDGGDLHDCLCQTLRQQESSGLGVEAVVHYDELGQITAKFLQTFQLPSYCSLAASSLNIFPQGPQYIPLLFILPRKDGQPKHGHIKERPTVQLIFQHPHNPFFSLNQLHQSQFSMCDFLIDSLDLERKNLFHLARDKHALYSNQMQLPRRQTLWLSLEVTVHECHPVEVSLM